MATNTLNSLVSVYINPQPLQAMQIMYMCDIMYAYILDNFNFDFNSNLKCSHIYKFKYQSMFDHYADHHLFDHCAVHHMSKSYVVILMHNTVVYIYLHSYKINILICDIKICWVSKETLMHNSGTIISHCICHSIVKLLYIWEVKREICVL